MKVKSKFATFYFFSVLFSLLETQEVLSQSVANALKSGQMIKATFNGAGCMGTYVNVFKCGDSYDVKLSGEYWYGNGYHAKRREVVLNENVYQISSGEPGPRYEGDAGSFSIYGAGFAFNSKGQFYQAGVPDKILGTVSISKPKVWAVVIGINDYSDDINQQGTGDLTFCIKDAVVVYSFLRSPQGGSLAEGQIKLLKNANKSEILMTCQELYTQADANDLIIFYFSGHGAENLFVAQDEVLMHSELKDIIYRSKANKKLCIADACHSGSWNKKADLQQRARLNPSETLELYYQTLSQSSEGIALFMASQANEFSIESPQFAQGVFTYYLIEGIKGNADSDMNRIITINELYIYVRSKVGAWSAANGESQHPELKGKFDHDMPVGIRSN